MRDPRFIADHRGGLLKKEQHRQLIHWAAACTRHIIGLLGEEPDDRLKNALVVAEAWEMGIATVGDARKASVGAHALARELSNPVSIAVARSAGHAVATAHMADHSIRAADYALKAVKSAGQSIEAERRWQDEQLPVEIREMVVEYRDNYFKMK